MPAGVTDAARTVEALLSYSVPRGFRASRDY